MKNVSRKDAKAEKKRSAKLEEKDPGGVAGLKRGFFWYE